MAKQKYNTIQEASDAYFAAKAKGDAAGMQAANNAANEIRKANGEAPQYATGDIAGVANANKNNANTVNKNNTQTVKPQKESTSQTVNNAVAALNSGSTYVPKGGYYDDDAATLMSTTDQNLLQSYKDGWQTATAAGDSALAAQYHQLAEALRNKYGYASAYGDGSGYIALGQEEFPAIWGPESPNYRPQYDGLMDSTLNNIVNRDPFSYNYLEDPLFQQYFEAYSREGNRAMLDAYGQAAARTGGYGSSYAAAAANQANNYYMAQLADVIPQLQQLAYEQYLDETAENYNQLGAIQGMDSIKYNRFYDDLGQWNTDRNFNYGAWRDMLEDAYYQDETAYQRWRDSIGDSRYQDELDYDRWLDSLQLGVAYGATPAASSSSSGSSGSGGGSRSSYNNGGLTTEQVKELQGYYGVTEDGKWGAQSTSAAGGMSAAEAWAKYNSMSSGQLPSIATPVLGIASGRSASNAAPTDYASGAAYLEERGADSSGLMTSAEWARHKNSGNDASGAAAYDTYDEYVQAYIAYKLSQ